MRNEELANDGHEIRIPDVVGYTLEEATRLITEAGIKIEDIRITAPPKAKGLEYDGLSRVIKLKRINDDKVELLVCKPL